MREITKRTAAFSAAIAGFALLGSGCHSNKASEITNSVTSKITSAISPSPATTAETPGATSPSPGTAAPSPGAAAPGPLTSVNGTPYTVEGPILAKYNSLSDSARKDLGAPKGNQQKYKDGGVYQQFDGGVIINKTQAFVVWGKIRDKWNELGGSQGKLGYPTSDETTNADGSKQTTFEHGIITWKQGDAEATVTEH